VSSCGLGCFFFFFYQKLKDLFILRYKLTSMDISSLTRRQQVFHPIALT